MDPISVLFPTIDGIRSFIHIDNLFCFYQREGGKKATPNSMAKKTIPDAMMSNYLKFVTNLDNTGFGFRGGLVPLLPKCGTDEGFDSANSVPDPSSLICDLGIL